MGFVRAVGRKIKVEGKPLLLRGFGLGGWLLPEGYMWKFYTKCDRPRRMEALLEELCGQAYAISFWRRYFDTYITREDIAWIAEEGFNSVRLPLNARHLDQEETWRRVDDCIAWCKEYGLYVILDMHGAPGGQTGQNIDDSENDQPELFQNRAYQQELIGLWRRIALRYRDEEAVAGYDLLNEPLPEFFSQYNHLVLPLYRELAKAIREVDPHHMLIVEGVHWATDFSIFDPLEQEPLDDNCLLQFHRYWSAPDRDGIEPFLACRDRLKLPLLMGEGGENNLDWYKAAFALYERLDISWSFWTYKKMDCHNSPATFPMPQEWPRILAYLDGGPKPPAEEARRIFDGFLEAVAHGQRNPEVIRALRREAPLTLPAEHFDQGYSLLPRLPGTAYRFSEPLSILFHSGKTGTPDYRRMEGEPQPEEERLYVLLREGEKAQYRYRAAGPHRIRLRLRGEGTLTVRVGEQCFLRSILTEHWQDLEIPELVESSEISYFPELSTGELPGQQRYTLELACEAGAVQLDEVQMG